MSYPDHSAIDGTTLETIEHVQPSLAWRAWMLAQRAAALVLLLLALPLLALMYVAVRIDSRGPFLYSQRRPGHRGRPFTTWKVRSMTVGADRNPMLARAVTADTPEVTRVGRLLRDLKLDELPQLWNVLRGDMLLVGPRPIAASLQQHLERHIPGFAIRLAVPPGLTSLGQVCIEGNEDAQRVVQDWTVRFEAECHYIAHRSVAYDLVIIGMTAAYCARKVLRRLPGTAAMPWSNAASVLLAAVLAGTGCAEQRPQELQARDGLQVRQVPWTRGAPVPAVVSRERIEVATLARGEPELMYRLGAGDRLSINVFGEPGMDNLAVQLDGAGDIQLPMLQRVAALGLSLAELQTRLETGYAAHFKSPWVTVQLAEPLSRPLYLLGEFNQPGIVHMTGPTNLIQALGEGHGLSSKAWTRGARLIRDEHIMAVDIHALLHRGRMDQNLWLQPNDTVFVPGAEEMRVFVLGAVEQPGVQQIGDGAPTLAEAIARSGGPRRGEARLEEIRVIRAESPVAGELMVVDFTRVLRGEAMDITLAPGDIVYLPVNAMGGWNDVIKAVSPTVSMLGRALDPFVLAKSLEDN